MQTDSHIVIAGVAILFLVALFAARNLFSCKHAWYSWEVDSSSIQYEYLDGTDIRTSSASFCDSTYKMRYCPMCNKLQIYKWEAGCGEPTGCGYHTWRSIDGCSIKYIRGFGFDKDRTEKFMTPAIADGIERARAEYAKRTGTAYAAPRKQPDGKTKVEIEPNATVVHGESGEKYVITGNPPMCARVVEG